MVTTTNVPQTPAGAAPQLPGQSSFPQTTKPRQIPGGGGGLDQGGGGAGEMPGAAMGFDPTSNGASTLPAPATLGAEPVTDSTAMAPQVTNDPVQNVNPRVSAIAAEILRDNPRLPRQEAHRLATLAFDRYLMREPGWEHNPLAVVAAKDVLDPDLPQGRGEPLPPRGPGRPQVRQEDVPQEGQEHAPEARKWYQQQGETPRDLANAVIPAEHSLWDRMTGGHETHAGGRS